MAKHHHLRMPQLPVKYIFGFLAVVSIISFAVTMKYKVASIVPIIQDSSFQFSFALSRQTTSSFWTAGDQMDHKSLRYKPSPYLQLNLPITTVSSKEVGTQDFEDWIRLPRNSKKDQTCLRTPNGSWFHIYQNAPWRADVKDVGAPYLCVETPGRLGNSMFTFASAVGIAAMTNRTVVVPPTFPLLRHFRLRALVDCDGSRCSDGRVVRVWEKKCCTFDPNMTSPRPKARSLFIRNYLQSWRYFAQAEADVRRQMTAYGDTAARAAAVIAGLRQELGRNVTLVGVHVRRGDIVRVARYWGHGYQVPPAGYFLRAISFFAARHPRIAFLFSTDTESYVQDTILPLCNQYHLHVHGGGPSFGASVAPSGDASLKGAPYVSVSGVTASSGSVMCRQISTNDPVVDLLMLASCDHVIMSVGTFGWWAGWLAGGDVVYYKHPTRPNSTISEKTKMEDFFPPLWIPLE